MLTGTSKPIAVRVFGDDLRRCSGRGDDVLDRIKKVDGVTDANMELQLHVPQVEVEVDLAKAQASRRQARRRAPRRVDVRRQ